MTIHVINNMLVYQSWEMYRADLACKMRKLDFRT